ncbi:hypothetical protein ABH966_002143 [Lysinibacillus sp. RC46]|uniref:hypothetical protein n=1 Tax=Lysinibacillus sp. RC46 TaxID=3156295 RepID=UPI003514721C
MAIFVDLVDSFRNFSDFNNHFYPSLAIRSVASALLSVSLISFRLLGTPIRHFDDSFHDFDCSIRHFDVSIHDFNCPIRRSDFHPSPWPFHPSL